MSLFKRNRWRDRTDAELLAAARSDPSPFRELYDRYARRVLAYHRRRCRDEAAAYDLTAETFAAAFISSQYKDIVAFLLLVFILLFRPTGLLGKPEVEKV